ECRRLAGLGSGQRSWRHRYGADQRHTVAASKWAGLRPVWGSLHRTLQLTTTSREPPLQNDCARAVECPCVLPRKPADNQAIRQKTDLLERWSVWPNRAAN